MNKKTVTKTKKQPLSLTSYRPDANEATMLLEALTKQMAKIKLVLRPSFGIPISATEAKKIVQSAYLLTETYTPELIARSIQQIIESDRKHLAPSQQQEAFTGLSNTIAELITELTALHDALTTLYRAIPIHYRIGYIFRDSTAKSVKQKLKNTCSMLKKQNQNLHSCTLEMR